MSARPAFHLPVPRTWAARLLPVLMLAFATWFSAYSIRLDDAYLTHKADLGQMDLAIWNTAHGRFVQEIKNETISTRLTDHVELIFAPVSLVFWLWDDVRALLVLQATALALGAWPIFLFARRRLALAGLGGLAGWGGLAFAAAYLLAPALQAAAVAEFHAVPLAAPLIALAFWLVEERRWAWFVLAAALVIGVQEGMALLGAALGVYCFVQALGRAPGPGGLARQRAGLAAGVFVCLLGLAWFYLATFIIIPHYATQAYGLEATPYTSRYGALGDSFGAVLKSFVTQPLVVWRTVAEPLRLAYLAGLLASGGFLALLAPGYLLLGLPLLLANLLSAYPFQYSGQLHYSAPLVPYFVAGAAAGLARLAGLWRRRGAGPATAPALASLLLLGVCAVGGQVRAGYTPVGREYWRGLLAGWPQPTPHDLLAARFLAEIPAGAPASTTAALYPHLSHRELLYQFPAVGQAEWALVDVPGERDRHPLAVQSKIQDLLANGWGVADAAGGYILLQKGGGQPEIPAAFYDFARAPDAGPQHTLDITWGGTIRLLGYDVMDDARWRSTGLRFYWQALRPLPAETSLSIQIVEPDGTVADDNAQRPMPALLWYPPGRWQPGETVVTESAPWYLPKTWAPVITIEQGGAVLAPVVGGGPETGDAAMVVEGRLRLPGWTRLDGRLVLSGAPEPSAPVSAHFGGKDWDVQLDGARVPEAAAPGSRLPVWLRWRTAGPDAAPRDYTVFVQLRDQAGHTVANGDARPAWFVTRPTAGWQATGAAPFVTWDAHTVALPTGLQPGTYTLVAGWYDWESGGRLPVIDPVGNVTGDELVLADVKIDERAALSPDLSCLLVPQSCASQ